MYYFCNVSGKRVFNCESFLGLVVLYHERTKNQDSEHRAAFRVFDKEGKREQRHHTSPLLHSTKVP